MTIYPIPKIFYTNVVDDFCNKFQVWSGPEFGLSYVERPEVHQLLEKHTVQEALLIFMKEMVDRTGERNSTERLARVFEDDPPSQPGHSSRL